MIGWLLRFVLSKSGLAIAAGLVTVFGMWYVGHRGYTHGYTAAMSEVREAAAAKQREVFRAAEEAQRRELERLALVAEDEKRGREFEELVRSMEGGGAIALPADFVREINKR